MLINMIITSGEDHTFISDTHGPIFVPSGHPEWQLLEKRIQDCINSYVEQDENLTPHVNLVINKDTGEYGICVSEDWIRKQ